MQVQYTYTTDIGTMTFVEDDSHIIGIHLNNNAELYLEMETPLIKCAYEQICEYLDGERISFDFPIKLTGTVFQEKVWLATMAIPYQETRSYLAIARLINHPRAYRAVGTALSKSPLSIVIPAHRVLGSNNNLGGFKSDIDIKLKLLNLEQTSKFKLDDNNTE